MTNNTDSKGKPFEEWVRDVIMPYSPAVKLTKAQEHFDIEFTYGETHYLLECKCFSYFKGRERTVNSLCIQESQIKHLRNMGRPLYGENKIRYVVGILFSRYDMYPITMSFDTALEMATPKTGKKRWISMNKLIRQRSLRNFMGHTFDIDPSSIILPPFHVKGDLND